MRLFELERIPDYKGEKDWADFTQTAYWINHPYDSAGSFGGLDFRIYSKQGIIRIVGMDGQLIQSYLTLMSQEHGYHVQAVQVASTYRGRGIAVHMYEIALKQLKLTVVSDYQQTVGGSAIWNRLKREPGVQVDSIGDADSVGSRLRAIAA